MKDLKQLQILQQKYKDELAVLRPEVSRLNMEIRFKQEAVQSIQKEIEERDIRRKQANAN